MIEFYYSATTDNTIQQQQNTLRNSENCSETTEILDLSKVEFSKKRSKHILVEYIVEKHDTNRKLLCHLDTKRICDF